MRLWRRQFLLVLLGRRLKGLEVARVGRAVDVRHEGDERRVARRAEALPLDAAEEGVGLNLAGAAPGAEAPLGTAQQRAYEVMRRLRDL